jgi:hypothetical protein
MDSFCSTDYYPPFRISQVRPPYIHTHTSILVYQIDLPFPPELHKNSTDFQSLLDTVQAGAAVRTFQPLAGFPWQPGEHSSPNGADPLGRLPLGTAGL